MIYLMRHGQDDENYIGGWSNLSLTKEGVDEVKNTAKWIKDNLSIKKIITSDINRAVETANIVNELLNVDILITDKLREQNKGKLNGMLKTEADKKYPDFREGGIDTIYPNGESLIDLYNRIKKYIEEILKFDNDTLIITHRGVINMIYYILNNKELDFDKKQFMVTVNSIHELDQTNKTIKKIR